MTTVRRVLFVGYDLNPATAGRGGVAVYQRSLAEALVAAGCRVTLFLGSRHTLRRRPRLQHSFKDGLKVIELLDSPLRHCDYRARPGAQISNDSIDALTAAVLTEERPDVVHVHDPRLHPTSVVDVAVAMGIPAVKTLHSYHDVCPQGELMAFGEEPCTDFEEGRRCRECLATLPALSPLKEDFAGSLRGTKAHGVARRWYRQLRGEAAQPAAIGGARRRGRRLPHLAALYGWRRRSMLAQLGRYDALHCSSEHMAQVLEGHGVGRETLQVIPITSCLPESILPVSPPEGPLTFGFVTGAAVSKGVHVLLDAFARLPAGKARLVAHGFEDPLAWEARYPLPGVSFRPPYDPYAQINSVMRELHVGVVPSVFAEPFGLAGLEFHAARLPVIASDTGGIPEWLSDGVNGVLVPPGDPGALAAAMKQLIDEPERVATLRTQIRPWKTMREHALEILELYEDTLALRRGQLESQR